MTLPLSLICEQLCMYVYLMLRAKTKEMKGCTSGCWHWLFKREGDEGGKWEKVILKSYFN